MGERVSGRCSWKNDLNWSLEEGEVSRVECTQVRL